MQDDICTKLDWNLIGSASSHSQFAGVFASFVFAAMVVLVTLTGDGLKRVQALSLFTASFFILAADSVLFGISAGEQTCMRAQTEGLIASGMLAVGTALAITGLARLFETSIDAAVRHELLRLTVVIAYGTQLIGLFYLPVTVYGYLEALARLGYSSHKAPPEWTLWTYMIVLLFILAIGFMFRPTDPNRQAFWIKLAAYSSIGYCLVGVVLSGTLAGLPQDTWKPKINNLLVYGTSATTVLLPVIVLIFISLAIPKSGHRQSQTNTSGTSDRSDR